MSDENKDIALAMVPLGPKPQVSPRAVKADLAKSWPALPAAEKSKKTEHGVIFELGDTLVTVALIPRPIPWSDLAGPCSTSILFPNAAETLKPHRSHALVALVFQSEFTPVERAMLLTKVTTSVVSTSTSTLGVYWVNATMVIPSELFCEAAVEFLPDPPLPIWIDFRVAPDENGMAKGFTCGMKALGLMEIEAESAHESPAELRERLQGLTAYLLKNGPIICDGDTIGDSEENQIKVNYAASSFGHDDQVMRLEYASAKKKSWFSLG